MQRYEVGSILYLIPTGNFVAVPAQVVEEVIRKSISGENIDYYVAIPGKEKTILLEKFEGDIFQDISEMRAYLLEIATSKVRELVDNAEKLAKASFEFSEKPKSKPPAKKPRHKKSTKKSSDRAEVDLGNGQSAKIVVNDELKELLS